jgi:LmbE family N-acetylglucosaminyl deacetylase
MNWNRAALAGAGLLLAACAGENGAAPAGIEPASTDFSSLLAGKSILFFGAHPDDETVSIAMMAEACLHNRASCHFVVVSDYKSYGCYLTIGLADPHECSRLRRAEMLASAALVGGAVEFYGWEEYFFAHDQAGLQRNLARWDEDNGGRSALHARIHESLTATGADVVIALDPRHGTSCHPNHRAATLLLMEAIDTTPADSRPAVYFENNFYITANPLV